MIPAIKDALNSKKALGAMATLASATWFAQQHIITGDQWTEIVKYVMTAWLGAQGIVDTAKALGFVKSVAAVEPPLGAFARPPGGIFGGPDTGIADVGDVPPVPKDEPAKADDAPKG